MENDIDDWLGALGLSRYAEIFHEHDITTSILASITVEDLRDMGIVSVGHRRQLLDAIAYLRNDQANGLVNRQLSRKKDHHPITRSQERRQLSVVFTDLVGSTQLSEQLDVEELTTLLSDFKSIVTEVTEEYGGFISQYLGDGVLAYFGWPQAYEHDVERAIRSSLRITESMQLLGKQHGIKMNCRIGIATGNVVVGDHIRNSYIEEDQAVGRAPNLAARIQLMADPGTVAISDETKEIVSDKFEFVDLGDHKLKGFKGQIKVWQVRGLIDETFVELERSSQEILPLTNQKAELAELNDTWHRIEHGQTQAMVFSGEPGIGKSRLIEEFSSQVLGQDGKVMCFHCSPFHTNDALYPIYTFIWTRILRREYPGSFTEAERLEAFLASAALDQNKMASLRESLIGFRKHSSETDLTLDAQGQKEVTLQALIALLEGYVKGKKVLLVFEDLHWVDPTTKDLLGRLVETIKAEKVMMVFTCRPNFQADWESSQRIKRLELKRLSNEAIGEIAANVYGVQPLPMRVLEVIVERADGVPLFAEELSKSFIETQVLDRKPGESVSMDIAAIPTSLSELLIARLDRYPESRRVLQTAATIGRDFSLETLSAVIEESKSELEESLEELVTAQIIVAKADTPGTFSFRHALMRDAAYHTMLRSVRAMVHARVAGVLKSTFRKVTPEHVLGNHWGLSGNHAEAARCFCQAAELARSRYANTEAKAYYETALSYLDKVDLSEGTNSDALPSRVDLLEQLGQVLTLVHDLDDAVAAFKDAAEIAGGDVLRIARLHRLAGNALQQDRERSLKELSIAESVLIETNWQDDSELLCEWTDIQLNRLNVHYWSGDGETMLELAANLAPLVDRMTPEQRAEYYDQLVLRDLRMSRYEPTKETHKTAEDYVSVAMETSNLATIASAQFILGFVKLHSAQLNEACVAMNVSLESARASGHRKIEVRCMTYMATVYRRMGQAEDSVQLSHESIALASELGMHEYIGLAKSNLAWAAWKGGSVEEARIYAMEALAQFDKSSIAYPFEWSAILPLIAVSQTGDTIFRVPDLCARMIDPSQQILPKVIRVKAAELSTMTSADGTNSLAKIADELIAAAHEFRFM
jgi:class 3 adenylate cyclase/tetratricopeptide (TPR) repeat protein